MCGCKPESLRNTRLEYDFRDSLELVLGHSPVAAPATLGPQAPLSGRLAASFEADVLTLTADPLANIGVLAQPEHITGVWRSGRQVKG